MTKHDAIYDWAQGEAFKSLSSLSGLAVRAARQASQPDDVAEHVGAALMGSVQPATGAMYERLYRRILPIGAEEAWQGQRTLTDWLDEVSAWLSGEGRQEIARLAAGTMGVMVLQAQRAARGAASVEMAARLLRVQLHRINAWRSWRIGRTAATGALGAGGMAGARSAAASGVQLRKVWTDRRDGRVRETHALAHGQAVELEQPFRVGGYVARYPGDHRLPPKERFNCRCRVSFVRG